MGHPVTVSLFTVLSQYHEAGHFGCRYTVVQVNSFVTCYPVDDSPIKLTNLSFINLVSNLGVAVPDTTQCM